MARGPVTLSDVAREAGVSLATASRSLNGSTRQVAEDYRERVLAAADRLGYRVNVQAQSVAKGTSTTLGLVIADITDPYFAAIAAGVHARAQDSGLVVTMVLTDRDTDRELEAVRALRSQRPHSILLTGSRRKNDPTEDRLRTELAALRGDGGSVVLITQADPAFDAVAVDNTDGARRLAIELARIGYRRFGVLGGQPELLTASDRVDGFLAGLAEAGIPADAVVVVDGPLTRDGGYRAAISLLATHGDDIDLVFAVTDVMAIGAMSAIRASGRTPGKDIAVAGFDDIQTAEDVTPTLTTVRVPLVEMGRSAVDLALHPAGMPRHTAFDTEIVIRESSPRR